MAEPTTMDKLLEALDREQRDAVTATEKAVLVAAGAGSGKTRTLTARVAYLIHEMGVPPYGIVAVTFTRKAAEEMRKRLLAILGDQYSRDPLSGLRVGTFHSLCATALRNEPAEVLRGLGRDRNFTVYDRDDSHRVWRKLLRDAGIESVSENMAHAMMSRWKNEMLKQDDALAVAQSPEAVIAARLWSGYDRAVREANAFDFDDLLTVPVDLMSDPAIRRRWAEPVAQMLVDEFQDTNPVQVALVERMVSVNHNLFAVGDDQQSIYGFRGARVEHFRSFAERFPGAKTYLLQTNYRSTQSICNVANAISDQASESGVVHKSLVSSEHLSSRRATYRRLFDEQEEAKFVCGEARALINAHLFRPESIAVLMRTNAQTLPFEHELVRLGIPFRLLGGTRFFDRAEIRDAVAYLRTLLNPRDGAAFLRALGSPRRGIGSALTDAAEGIVSTGVDWPAALSRVARSSAGNAKGRAAVLEFLSLHRDGAALIPHATPAQIVDVVLQGSGLLAAAEEGKEENSESRADNLKQLVSVALPYPVGALARFVEAASLEAAADGEGQKANGVTLATIHAAKGLEWLAVFVVGLEAGLLPQERDTTDPEEERRLAYVAVTRARKILVLTGASRRAIYGRVNQMPVSPFVRDVNPFLGKELPY